MAKDTHAHGEVRANITFLGSVDISPQPDESCDKAKKAQEASVELVESGENASEMFDLAHKALD
ncbi:MAG: hypothetical protein GX433_11990, partial [Deltaproteobacteria bacterium]|nr:hypothetical protein [Deltaproteobacteria bacterium]